MLRTSLLLPFTDDAMQSNKYLRSGYLFVLGVVYILAITVYPHDQFRVPARKDRNLSSGHQTWDAAILIPGLDQNFTLTANLNTCNMFSMASTPRSVTLLRKIGVSLEDGRTLLVYAGWPRNDSGQITGVTNRSNDRRSALIENKLGPTVVWLVLGCQKVCIHSLILQYQATIIQNGREAELVGIENPYLDEHPGVVHCLGPNFSCKSLDESVRCTGVVDQPGTVVSAVGDGFASIEGERLIVSKGDQLTTIFQQRSFIECDNEIIALIDWGYQLKASLGLPAYMIAPQVDDDFDFEQILPTDDNVFNQLRLRSALKQLDAVHNLNHCP